MSENKAAKTQNSLLASTNTAERYIWGEGCTGWHLVKNELLSVIQEEMPPGTSEVRHFHKKAQQFFYMLQGEATMEVNGKEIAFRAGEGIQILPGTLHKITNRSEQPIQFLVISQPPSHGDRVIASK